MYLSLVPLWFLFYPALPLFFSASSCLFLFAFLGFYVLTARPKILSSPDRPAHFTMRLKYPGAQPSTIQSGTRYFILFSLPGQTFVITELLNDQKESNRLENFPLGFFICILVIERAFKDIRQWTWFSFPVSDSTGISLFLSLRQKPGHFSCWNDTLARGKGF